MYIRANSLSGNPESGEVHIKNKISQRFCGLHFITSKAKPSKNSLPSNPYICVKFTGRHVKEKV